MKWKVESLVENVLVLASKNAGKLAELNQLLMPLNVRAVSRADLNFDEEIVETGVTFEENAQLKAITCFKRLNLPTLADDSGLEIEALGGMPGVLSARYASVDGRACSNEQNIAKILNEMKNETNRAARMVCSLCFINQYGKMFTVTESCCGQIATTPTAANGFGFDFIFEVNGVMLSKLSMEVKNKISHRGKAMQKFLCNFKGWWNAEI